MTDDLRDRMMDVLLDEVVGGQAGPDVSDRVARRLCQHRLRWRWAGALAAAGLLVVAGLAIHTWLLGRDRQAGPGPTNQPIANATVTPSASPAPQIVPVVLASGWRVRPIGQAAFAVVAPDTIRLDRGELHVISDSTAGAIAPLAIDTPMGRALAKGTEFFIGTHRFNPNPNEEGEAQMKGITRVLVLAGVVTLANALGQAIAEKNELAVAGKDAPPAKLAITASNDFGFDLFRQLASDEKQKDKNIFISPYSATACLSMLAEGATGQGAAEMGKVMRFPEQAKRVGDDAQQIPWQTSLIHSGLADLTKGLLAPAKDPKAARHEIRIGNGMWLEKTYPFNKDYVDTVNKFYGPVLTPCNFAGQPDAERLKINKWAEEQTNQRIKDLLKQPDITANTVLALTNAVWFKGAWETPFDPKETKPGDFTLAGGAKTMTDMMTLQCGGTRRTADGKLFEAPKFSFAELSAEGKRIDRDWKTPENATGLMMVELPYKGSEMSMLLIAPNDPAGLPAVEKKLNDQTLSAWQNEMKPTELSRIVLPKFKLDCEYDLGTGNPKCPLQAMGMKAIFKPGNLLRIAQGSAGGDLYCSLVRQKSFVEVNEEGTEGAAVTVAMVGKTGMSPYVPSFCADRPFLFLIRDIKSGSVMFMGRYVQPEVAAQ